MRLARIVRASPQQYGRHGPEQRADGISAVARDRPVRAASRARERRIGGVGAARQTKRTTSSVARPAGEVPRAVLVSKEPDVSARDVSAALLLPTLLPSPQPLPAYCSAAHLVGTGLRTDLGAERQVMVMTFGAARRTHGSAERPDSEGSKGEEKHAESSGVDDAVAPSLSTHPAATRRPSGPTAPRGISYVGVLGTPEATGRRFQSPQPSPRGELAEVVHLPARAVGGAASAPPRARRPRGPEGTRLGNRQPRPHGRLVVPLHLPCRSALAGDSVTHGVVVQPSSCVGRRVTSSIVPRAMPAAPPVADQIASIPALTHADGAAVARAAPNGLTAPRQSGAAGVLRCAAGPSPQVLRPTHP